MKKLTERNDMKVKKTIGTISGCKIILENELDPNFPEKTYNDLEIAENIIIDTLAQKWVVKSQKRINDD